MIFNFISYYISNSKAIVVEIRCGLKIYFSVEMTNGGLSLQTYNTLTHADEAWLVHMYTFSRFELEINLQYAQIYYEYFIDFIGCRNTDNHHHATPPETLSLSLKCIFFLSISLTEAHLPCIYLHIFKTFIYIFILFLQTRWLQKLYEY